MSEQRMTNSLLSAAATGFSFEDAALLVPVTLDDDEPPTLDATSEIDLSSDDHYQDQQLMFVPSQDDNLGDNNSNVHEKASESSGDIPLFSFGSSSKDDWNLVPPNLPSSSNNSSVPFVPSSMESSPFVVSQPNVPMPPAIFNPVLNAQPTVSSVPMTSMGPAESGDPSKPPSVPPPTGTATPVSTSGMFSGSKGNSFRLGSQKRLVYAQYPGLSASSIPSMVARDPREHHGPIPPLANSITKPNLPPFVDELDVMHRSKLPPSPVPVPSPWSVKEQAPPPESYRVILDGRKSAEAIQAQFQPIQYKMESVSLTSSSTTVSNSKFEVPFSSVNQSPNIMQQQGYNQKPLIYHWFYRKDVDGRTSWRPFSTLDSNSLETSFSEQKTDLVATDGGRYDVDVVKKLKYPVYWEESPSEVRRCSWFFKGPMDSRFVPYEEDLSVRLENEYLQGINTGVWNRRIEFPGGEAIILYNQNAVSHFCQAAAPDEWGNLPESQLRPRVVKRGVEEFEIEEGESSQIDHLVFLVHGIGAICDFKFRTIEEAVDDFRNLSFQLMQTHFKEAVDSQQAGRIEFLPVSWHKALHGDGGIDQKLKPITLKSIPKLRNFTNDTLLDILFYTSPVYAQTIIDTVGSELNRLFNLFLTRNPTFNGHAALSGHSLGSLILFDLLAHQPKIGRYTKANESEISSDSQLPMDNVETGSADSVTGSEASSISRMVSYTIGSGTGQPLIKYPILEFTPSAFFALGSPIAMFVTVRGIDRLGEEFHFPTCPAFFNIFHPLDPVAYRMETLVDPNWDLRPVLIPHHKGRKRFHLELKETMQRVGADIKQKFLDSVKTTWNTVYQYATFSKGVNLEQEIDRVLEGELKEKASDSHSNSSGEDLDQDMGLGKLNGGRRIDYVLQEAPLESFNEYLFALSSHVCYWESEDTMLMIMREIYASMGIFIENQSKSEQQFSKSGNLPPSSGIPPPPLNVYDPYYNSGSLMASQSTPLSNINPNYGVSVCTFSQPIVPSASTPTPSFGQQQVPTSTFGNTTAPFFITQSQSTADHLFSPTPPSVNLSSAPSSNAGKPTIIGARPVISPDQIANLRGIDPTQPIMSTTFGPPPLSGFQRKK